MGRHLSQLSIQRRRSRVLQILEEKNDKEPCVSINDPTRDATFSVCREEFGFFQ